MNIIYNKFLIVSTLVIFLSGTYLYFSHNLNEESIIPVAYGSSLVSSTGGETASTSLPENKVDLAISFLNTLKSLKRITIDTSLFADKFFSGLINNKVELEQVVAGRTNPFSPIGANVNNNFAPVSEVVTNLATQVTDKTAILNGTINIPGVNNAYFEYGITDSLGSVTLPVKQSLVGTFIKNVSGLTPKTNYFFKACANINNAKLCGEVISFTTN